MVSYPGWRIVTHRWVCRGFLKVRLWEASWCFREYPESKCLVRFFGNNLVTCDNMFKKSHWNIQSTPRKFNIEAENDGFQKESPFPRADFQISRVYRVPIFRKASSKLRSWFPDSHVSGTRSVCWTVMEWFVSCSDIGFWSCVVSQLPQRR